MSKKDFKGGLNTLLGEGTQIQSPITRRGRPKTQHKIVNKTSEEGTRPGETRATFIITEELLEKVKAIAYWDRKLIKEVMIESLQDAVKKYENKNGSIKPIPKRKQCQQ